MASTENTWSHRHFLFGTTSAPNDKQPYHDGIILGTPSSDRVISLVTRPWCKHQTSRKQCRQAQVINGYLTDIPPSQNVTQGHFIVRRHTQIEAHAWIFQKMLGPFNILHIRVPQAPSNELPGRKAPWNQIIQLNIQLVRMLSRPMLLTRFKPLNVCHSDLLSFWLRYGTRPYEWGTQWHSNSLVKVCSFISLKIILLKVPYNVCYISLRNKDLHSICCGKFTQWFIKTGFNE